MADDLVLIQKEICRLRAAQDKEDELQVKNRIVNKNAEAALKSSRIVDKESHIESTKAFLREVRDIQDKIREKEENQGTSESEGLIT